MTQSIKNMAGIGSIALVAFMVLALPLSFAKADGLDGGGFDYYPDSSYSYYPDTSYSYYPDTTSGYDYYPDSSYNYYPDSSYDYYPDSYSSTPSYTTGGYTTGGYSTGGYTTGGGYMIGGGYPVSTPAPVVVPSAPSNTTVTTTTNDNTCTGNSCNHDDHSVVNITNPAPVINNNNVVANYQPTPVTTPAPTQVCAAGYYGTYPNCYRQQAPVAYNNQMPYVSLSQVPYTGLDLGFWGTIAYWGFMVAFALFAAYLIAIKRVQNSIANWMKSVLFGDTEEMTPAVAHVSHSTTVATPASPAPQYNDDAIDPFILSQINRRTA